MPRYGEGAAVGIAAPEREPMSGRRILGTAAGLGVTGYGVATAASGLAPRGQARLKSAREGLRAAQQDHLRARSDFSTNAYRMSPKWQEHSEAAAYGRKPSVLERARAQRTAAAQARKARAAVPELSRAMEQSAGKVAASQNRLKEVGRQVSAMNSTSAKLKRFGTGAAIAGTGAGALYLTRRRKDV